MPVLAFDMYGTLVDPASFAIALRGWIDDPERAAASWRRHQLEISWLLSVMGCYEDWASVTRYGLLSVLQESGLELADERLEEVLDRARIPALFDDVPDALEALIGAGHELAVFSNGTAAQLGSILAETGIAGYFSAVISVDEVGIFKPAPAVYEHAARRLGRAIGDVWLVSANPFDAAGAKAAGMRVAKLERGRSIRYGFAPPADLVIASLAELADLLPPPAEPRATE